MLALLVLPACTSLQNAGVADYSIRPIVINDRQFCCEVSVKNGKEFAALALDVEKTGDDYRIKLVELGVEAFKGQEISAGAAKEAIAAAIKAAIGLAK